MAKVKFIGYLDMLKALVKEGLIKATPDSKDEILIYHIGVDKKFYGVTEGWFSHKMTEFAQDLLESERERTEMFDFLRDKKGITPVFSEDGLFLHLEREV